MNKSLTQGSASSAFVVGAPLTGKVVLVTGASRGLGRAIALEFARRGAKLALAARSEDALDRTRREVESLGAEAIALRADVTS